MERARGYAPATYAVDRARVEAFAGQLMRFLNGAAPTQGQSLVRPSVRSPRHRFGRSVS